MSQEDQASSLARWLEQPAGAPPPSELDDDVVEALDACVRRGQLELKASGVRHRFRRLREPDDRAALAHSLHEDALVR